MLARFRLMQALIFATSGTNWLHSRMTSGVQACCCCGVPCAAAGAWANATARTRPEIATLAASQDDETFLSPAFFIGEPVPFGAWDYACGRFPGRILISRTGAFIRNGGDGINICWRSDRKSVV